MIIPPVMSPPPTSPPTMSPPATIPPVMSPPLAPPPKMSPLATPPPVMSPHQTMGNVAEEEPASSQHTRSANPTSGEDSEPHRSEEAQRQWFHPRI